MTSRRLTHSRKTHSFTERANENLHTSLDVIIAHAATTFANADGGPIVIGFKDPQNEKPLTNGDKINVSDEIVRGYLSGMNARIHPPLEMDIRGYTSQDKQHAFLLIRVARSTIGPHEYGIDIPSVNLPVRRGTATSSLRLAEIDALRARRKINNPFYPQGDQRYLPFSLENTGTNPDFIIGLQLTPQTLPRKTIIFDRNDDNFFKALEVRTQSHGGNKLHEPMAFSTLQDGILFATALPQSASGVIVADQRDQKMYIGSDGKVALRFKQTGERPIVQTLSVLLMAYTVGQELFFRLGLEPNASIHYIHHLDGRRLEHKPGIIGGYSRDFSINLATQTFADAFTDEILRLYRASNVSENREEIVSMLNTWSHHDRGVDALQERWLKL